MTDNLSHVSGVAKRYASALFELAEEQKVVEPTEVDIAALEKLLGESADLVRLVRSPTFSSDEQIGAMSAVLKKAEIGGLTANFVKLVASNRRLFALPDMLRGFHELAAAARGEVTADIVSAAKLDEANVAALKAALNKATGKDVKINATVDPELIGGLIVKVGSRMIDTSLRTRLNSLKIAMKEVG
ncbi:ATP synthase F1 subcomplex delta subunit [Breoghania corrubedonensis]|uniref:ATP synthase subunit delta n=1 Tax=Breoghania corrubedonensis TaxID=665038 RepID=A0A2T5VGU9_9HYPH|nr:F0F1 ATP synthase subunit delta [Breoghania corrubedonensis]PTW62983.1 ATP synthase F1 subcomplex delta subunit [Breoghania corrubedonensis]